MSMILSVRVLHWFRQSFSCLSMANSCNFIAITLTHSNDFIVFGEKFPLICAVAPFSCVSFPLNNMRISCSHRYRLDRRLFFLPECIVQCDVPFTSVTNRRFQQVGRISDGFNVSHTPGWLSRPNNCHYGAHLGERSCTSRSFSKFSFSLRHHNIQDSAKILKRLPSGIQCSCLCFLKNAP